MLQFYFLSVLLNVITGLVLVYAADFNKNGEESKQTSEVNEPDVVDNQEDDDGKIDKTAGFGKIIGSNAFFDDETFRLVLGILTGLVGIMKMLSVVQNDVPVVGDLFPALAGISGSICILLEYYKQRATVAPKFPPFVYKVFEGGRKYIGVFCIVTGLLHFIFPKVLFL